MVEEYLLAHMLGALAQLVREVSLQPWLAPTDRRAALRRAAQLEATLRLLVRATSKGRAPRREMVTRAQAALLASALCQEISPTGYASRVRPLRPEVDRS